MNFDFSKLIGPQAEHAIKLLDSIYINGVAADLSETGTGKSYVAAWVSKHLNSPIVVICPKVVIPSWKAVFKEFGIKAHVIINYELLIRGNTEYLNYHYDDMQVHFPKNALIIIDECHKCKGWNSRNGEMMIALKKNNHKLLLLSATAATNPLEMRSFGFATTLHNLTNYRKFAMDCGVYEDRFRRFKFDIESQQAAAAMANIHDKLFNQFKVASRMTRKMFDNIFPVNRVISDVFDMGTNTDEINHIYETMEAELAKLEEQSANYSDHHFAVMTKARRQTELLKVPTIVNMIEDLYDEGISPVVFVNFKDSVSAITKQLNKNSRYNDKIACIVGGQSDKEREEDIADFQADRKRIMIANLAAGNAGVSLHDLNGNYPRHSILCPSFSAINMLQALGRIHRAEAKTPCIQKIVFAANTIEEQACRRVQSKLNNLEALNTGDLTFSIKVI